jgi:hypothetical protein
MSLNILTKISAQTVSSQGFDPFTVYPDKYQDSALKQTNTTSFNILSNSLFTNPIIQQYKIRGTDSILK